MSKRKSAVWGYGNHAKTHVIPAMLMSARFDLVAIGSRKYGKHEVQRIEGREIAFCGEDELLADTSIDTVYITTPTGLHHEHCLSALNAGKNVLCEKPLTTSLEHTRDLIRLARQKRLFLCETFMYLFHPQYIALSQLLSSGQLGRICSMTCEFGLPPLEHRGFRQSAALGGGAFWDLACYSMSVVVHLLGGTPEVLYVSMEKGGDRREDTDSGGCALLRFQADTHVFLSWGYSRSYRNHLTVWGEKGTVVADRAFSKRDDYPSRLESYDQRGVRSHVDTGTANAFVNMLNQIGGDMGQTDSRNRFLDVAERQAIAMESLVQGVSSE